MVGASRRLDRCHRRRGDLAPQPVPLAPLRPREHGAGGLEHDPGRPLEMTDAATGEQITRLGAHVDPILVLFAPLLVARTRAGDADRRAGRGARGGDLSGRFDSRSSTRSLARVAASSVRGTSCFPGSSGTRSTTSTRSRSRSRCSSTRSGSSISTGLGASPSSRYSRSLSGELIGLTVAGLGRLVCDQLPPDDARGSDRARSASPGRRSASRSWSLRSTTVGRAATTSASRHVGGSPSGLSRPPCSRTPACSSIGAHRRWRLSGTCSGCSFPTAFLALLAPLAPRRRPAAARVSISSRVVDGDAADVSLRRRPSSRS